MGTKTEGEIINNCTTLGFIISRVAGVHTCCVLLHKSVCNLQVYWELSHPYLPLLPESPKNWFINQIFPTEKALSNWPIFWSVSVSAGWFNDDNAQQDDHRRQPVPDRVKDPQQRPAGIKNLKSEIKKN